MSDYKTVKERAQIEYIEKKSRFISECIPVSVEGDALEFIRSVKAKYPDATHHVYAYVLRENHTQRYSDAGELSGTAGVPTIEVLIKGGITDCCVVTTRYFGGILLGGGGLIRAYSKSASEAVQAAQPVTRMFCRIYKVTCDYSLLGLVQKTAPSLGGIAGEVEYADNVTLTYTVPHNITDFSEKLFTAANGRVKINLENEGSYIYA